MITRSFQHFGPATHRQSHLHDDYYLDWSSPLELPTVPPSSVSSPSTLAPSPKSPSPVAQRLAPASSWFRHQFQGSGFRPHGSEFNSELLRSDVLPPQVALSLGSSRSQVSNPQTLTRGRTRAWLAPPGGHCLGMRILICRGPEARCHLPAGDLARLACSL